MTKTRKIQSDIYWGMCQSAVVKGKITTNKPISKYDWLTESQVDFVLVRRDLL